MKTVQLDKLGKLKEAGAIVVKPIEISTYRKKATGWMWQGTCILALDHVQLNFTLNHHGGDNETPTSLQKYFKLEYVGTSQRFYDSNWYTIFSTTGLYLHKRGWFQDEELRNRPIIKSLPNTNLYGVELTEGEKALLLSLGFELLIEL